MYWSGEWDDGIFLAYVMNEVVMVSLEVRFVEFGLCLWSLISPKVPIV